ncbi:MAG: hypothetical protein AB7F23_02485 [Phycisphaerae bacterium]
MKNRSSFVVSPVFKASNMLFVMLLVAAVMPVLESKAAIAVNGVSTQNVYSDSATFAVVPEVGYDYSALLNGEPVAVGSDVVVDAPDYYELAVSRVNQATLAEESLLVQFVVRASERFDTEWGLPLWTPFPLIDSAAGEFEDSEIKIVTPATYPLGLEIPVIARVSGSTGKRTGVNGKVVAQGFEDYPLQLLRGTGSVFLPAATASGVINYNASVKGLQAQKNINIESATVWTNTSGTISTDTDWGENARIKITATLTIAENTTLTIGAGSVVVVAPGVSVGVGGHIIVNGSDATPVVFTAQDRDKPWGGFLFESASCSGTMTGAIFTASGADSNWFPTHKSGDFYHKPQQCLFYLSGGSRLNLTSCYMTEHYGQLGHGEDSYLDMTGCLVQKFITCGQYNAGSVNATDCALIEFPADRSAFADSDNDVIYLNGGPHSFTDCLMGWTLDDGIDAGEGETGAVTISGCWFESCIHEATAWSCSTGAERYAQINDSVFINCGQAIECGYNSPIITATNVLCTANVSGARFGDNYGRSYTGSLEVRDSLLLFNYRDIMNRTWNDWQEHLSQTDIQGNLASALPESYPDNTLWDSQEPAHLARLGYFLPTAASVVGVGITSGENYLDLPEDMLEYAVPVRLSTFTTASVSVDYAVNTNLGHVTAGVMNYVAGESLKSIDFTLGSLEGVRWVSVVLSNPVNAEITNYGRVVYEKPYELQNRLLSGGEQWEYFKGQSEPPADWNSAAFAPSEPWLTGETPFGYDTDSNGNLPCITTVLSDMRGNYYSLYARNSFTIHAPSRVTGLVMSVKWDDGFIAYINGVPVSNQYGPAVVAYNQPASTSNHEAYCDSAMTEFDLSDYISLLNAGENVLAFQVHNATINSSDMFFNARLDCAERPAAGDFEPDGDVDFADLTLFASAWLSADGAVAYDWIFDIDPDMNGVIDLADWAVFVQNWFNAAQ